MSAPPLVSAIIPTLNGAAKLPPLLAVLQRVSTRHPLEIVAIDSGGLATSSTTVRRWRRGDVVVHHLLDPRSGRPAEGPWRTASAVAATCVDANVAATAAIVLGSDAVAWLESTALPARLVADDGSICRVNGWPVPDTPPGAS